MAIFHFEIRPIKRSTGQQATAAAAYRAGETIRDERSGEVHNFSRRKDVRHSEIVLPSKYEESTIAWAQDRARLWNKVEAAERRRDARVAREYQVALPPELSPEQRLALARSFSIELADRYGVAVDLAIHDPKPGRPSSNFHAHLLTTTREVNPTGLGEKAGLDMGAVGRAERGLPTHPEEYSTLRERWATLTNQALQEANIEARVDHRSLAAQGVDRKPLVHVPLEFYQLERQGVQKETAERLREEYRTRITAYRERSAGAAPAADTAQSNSQHDRQAAPQAGRASQSQNASRAQSTSQPENASQVQSASQAQSAARAQSIPQPQSIPQLQNPSHSQSVPQSRDAEEIRRRAVQAWLRMRSKEGESTHAASNDAEVSRGSDEELGR